MKFNMYWQAIITRKQMSRETFNKLYEVKEDEQYK